MIKPNHFNKGFNGSPFVDGVDMRWLGVQRISTRTESVDLIGGPPVECCICVSYFKDLLDKLDILKRSGKRGERNSGEDIPVIIPGPTTSSSPNVPLRAPATQENRGS